MSTEEQLAQIKGFDSIKKFYKSNNKNISIAAGILIVLVVGFYYYFKVHKPGQEKEAYAKLFTAERYIKNDSVDKALNGDGIYPGTRQVADDYGNTKAGNLASYYTGSLLLRKGEFEEAIEYLEDCDFDDQFHAASRITLIGDCYSELGNYEKAGDYYMKAANKRENKITTPVALLKAGYAYEAGKNYSDALEALTRLMNDYPESIEGRKAETLIGKVEAEQHFNK